MELDSGVFLISLDLELCWSAFDIGDLHLDESLRVRETVGPLLELLSKYDIAATWDVVGHLFLESCEETDGRKHPEMLRPNHAWFPHDWYTYDPCTDVHRDPAWYAPDLIKMVIASPPGHEIGAHSFAHIVFGDSGCSEPVAENDVRRWIQAAREFGLDSFSSFVFPLNRVGHLDVLRRNGFRAYRGDHAAWFNRPIWGRLGRRLLHVVDLLLYLRPPCPEPVEALPGLWDLSASMVYLSMFGIRKHIPLSCRVLKAKKGIEHAIRTRRMFHIWMHPFDLTVETERMFDGLEQIFEHVAARRDEGALAVMTMQQLTEHLERRRACES